MGNILPTVTIVLAEIAAVLAILLGFMFYRLRRLRALHQAEIETLMEIAGQARSLHITPPAMPAIMPAPPIPPGASAPVAPEPHADTPKPDPEPDLEPDREAVQTPALADHIDSSLAELRIALEHIDTRIDQFRHEHNRLASQFKTLIGESSSEIHSSRRDLDKINQSIIELRKQIASLSGASPRHETMMTKPIKPQGVPIEISPATPKPPAVPATPVTAASPVKRTSPTAAPIDSDMLGRFFGDARIEGIDVEEINLSDLDIEYPHGRKDDQSRFDEDRIFFQSSLEEGRAQGWYFTGYGAQPHGPFKDRDTAARAMQDLQAQHGDPDVPSPGEVTRKSG